jgi:hypothetical protein
MDVYGEGAATSGSTNKRSSTRSSASMGKADNERKRKVANGLVNKENNQRASRQWTPQKDLDFEAPSRSGDESDSDDGVGDARSVEVLMFTVYRIVADRLNTRNNLYWITTLSVPCLWYGNEEPTGTLQLVNVTPVTCLNRMASGQREVNADSEADLFQPNNSVSVSRSSMIPLDHDILFQFCSNGTLFDVLCAFLDYAEWDEAGKHDYMWTPAIYDLLVCNNKLDRWINDSLTCALRSTTRNRRELFTLLLCARLMGIDDEYRITKDGSLHCSDGLLELISKIRKLNRQSFSDCKGSSRPLLSSNSKGRFARTSSRVGDGFQASLETAQNQKKVKTVKSDVFSAVLHDLSAAEIQLPQPPRQPQQTLQSKQQFFDHIDFLRNNLVCSGYLALAPAKMRAVRTQESRNAVSEAVCRITEATTVNLDSVTTAQFLELVGSWLPPFDISKLLALRDSTGPEFVVTDRISYAGGVKLDHATHDDCSPPYSFPLVVDEGGFENNCGAAVQTVLVIARVRFSSIDDLVGELARGELYDKLIAVKSSEPVPSSAAQERPKTATPSEIPETATTVGSLDSGCAVDICCVSNGLHMWWIPSKYCISCSLPDDCIFEILHDCHYKYDTAISIADKYCEKLALRPTFKYGIDAIASGNPELKVECRGRLGKSSETATGKSRASSLPRSSDDPPASSEKDDMPAFKDASDEEGVVDDGYDSDDCALVPNAVVADRAHSSEREFVTVVTTSDERDGIRHESCLADIDAPSTTHRARGRPRRQGNESGGNGPQNHTDHDDSTDFRNGDCTVTQKVKREKRPNSIYSTYELDVKHVQWGTKRGKKVKVNVENHISTQADEKSACAVGVKQDVVDVVNDESQGVDGTGETYLDNFGGAATPDVLGSVTEPSMATGAVSVRTAAPCSLTDCSTDGAVEQSVSVNSSENATLNMDINAEAGDGERSGTVRAAGIRRPPALSKKRILLSQKSDKFDCQKSDLSQNVSRSKNRRPSVMYGSASPSVLRRWTLLEYFMLLQNIKRWVRRVLLALAAFY